MLPSFVTAWKANIADRTFTIYQHCFILVEDDGKGDAKVVPATPDLLSNLGPI